MATWQLISFQDSASPCLEQLIFFHDFTMSALVLVISLIGFSMMFLLVYKVSDRYLVESHNIEIIWTVLPVFILLGIALPSLRVLYLLDDPFSPNLSVKAMGHQWYWSYEYSDFSGLEFDSYMLSNLDDKGLNRLLECDNSVVLPVNSNIRVITSSSDVIHAWTVPSLGIKVDAIPGRLNQMMFYINRSGIFYGQCSEICGSNHSFMPIKIEGVPSEVFVKWVQK